MAIMIRTRCCLYEERNMVKEIATIRLKNGLLSVNCFLVKRAIGFILIDTGFTKDRGFFKGLVAITKLKQLINSLPPEEENSKERSRPRINQFCFLKEDPYGC
jgi:hypothetical protein